MKPTSLDDLEVLRQKITRAKQETIQKSLPFWCGDYQGSEFCCYNHRIGLPKKDGTEHPIYAYEEELFEDIEQYNYLAIVKATGLGITEFFLRYAEWKALFHYKNAHIVIFTGPNLNLAKMQIRRIQDHLRGKYNYSGTDYRLEINTNVIEAFPSMNIDAARSLPNPKFIMIDEAAFFKMVNDEEIRAIAERYELKSQSKVVIYSTPGLPSGMFYDLIKEEPTKYAKRYLDYRRGLQPHKCNLGLTIYDPTKLDEAKKSPSFEREYNLQWGYGTGNIFPYQLLDKCVEEYDLAPQSDDRVLFYDPAFGSSMFGILGMEKRSDGLLYILDAEEFERSSFPAMLERLKFLTESKYHRVLGDNSRPEIVKELQDNGIDATGVIFSKELTEMTITSSQKVKELQVRIHPIFKDLLLQLRSVEYNDKGHPDKKKISFDLGDPFMMGCKHFATSFYGGILRDNW